MLNLYLTIENVKKFIYILLYFIYLTINVYIYVYVYIKKYCIINIK